MEWNQEGRCCSQLATSSARDFSQAQNWTYTFWVPFFVRISPLRCFPAILLFFVFFFNKIRDCMFTRCSHPCQMQRTCFLGTRAFCWRCDATKKPKQMRARGPNRMFFTPSPKPQRMLQQTWIYFKYQFKVPAFPEKNIKNCCTSDSTQMLRFYWLPCATGTLASD